MGERARCATLGQALPLSGLWFAQLSSEENRKTDFEGTDSTSILWRAAGNRR